MSTSAQICAQFSYERIAGGVIWLYAAADAHKGPHIWTLCSCRWFHVQADAWEPEDVLLTLEKWVPIQATVIGIKKFNKCKYENLRLSCMNTTSTSLSIWSWFSSLSLQTSWVLFLSLLLLYTDRQTHKYSRSKLSSVSAGFCVVFIGAWRKCRVTHVAP